MKLLYYCQSTSGGISDYTHDQINALVKQGVDATLLCAPGFKGASEAKYKIDYSLKEEVPQRPNSVRTIRRVQLASAILSNFKTLEKRILDGGFDQVLMSFSEYLAPMWVRRFQKLSEGGVRFSAVVHDPVRDYQVGPAVWHQKSVEAAYSFLDNAFVHEGGDLPIPNSVNQVVIPYGCHQMPGAIRSRNETRATLDIPSDARLLLAFGFLRDNKNLDLLLRALVENPALFLLVAGPDMEGGNKPMSFYRNLADELGIADRCRWIGRFVREAEMAELFQASDLSVLTYSKSFRSASSAMSTSAYYQVPCIASAGQGNLQSVVQRYKLGVWVEPDSESAIRDGLKKWQAEFDQPEWDSYFAENSWQENARMVVETVFPS